MLSKKLCEQFLGGALTDHRTYVSGRYRGYHVVSYMLNGSAQMINISATSELDPDGGELNTYLNTLLPLYKQFKTATADGHSLTLSFAAATSKKFVTIANDIVSRVVSYLAQNSYTSGCSGCGSQSGAELYCINGHYMWLCADCAARYSQELEERKVDTKAQRSHLISGLVGAFLGALIGAILYVVIYQLGYIAGVCGLVMAVLALKFYEKLGGCLDLKGVIASIAVVMVMVFFANKIAWSISAYSALKENDWSFFECYRDLNYILEVTELKGSYHSDLAVGYLISAVGCLRRFIYAIKGSTGSFTFKKLEG